MKNAHNIILLTNLEGEDEEEEKIKMKFCEANVLEATVWKYSLQCNLRKIDVNSNPSDIAGNMISFIKDAVIKSTTCTKIKTKLRFKLCPWMNKNLQNLILFKRKLLTKRRKSKGNKMDDLLKRLSTIIKIANKLLRND